MNPSHITIQNAYITLAPQSELTTLEALPIRAVASDVSGLLYPDPARFTSEPSSGIVFDPLTGLMWAQQETAELDWDDAVKACRDCRLGGFDDWYLPTRGELLSILDLERHAPALPIIFESNNDYVWTSTQTAWSKGKTGSSRSFFCVNMGSGSVNDDLASYRLRARPVRRASPASQ